MAGQLQLQKQISQAMKRLRPTSTAHSISKRSNRAPSCVDGQIVGLEQQPRNTAMELIADFMIGANGVSARFLDQHRSPSLRRIVRQPKRWDRIVEVAARLGDKLPAAPRRRRTLRPF